MATTVRTTNDSGYSGRGAYWVVGILVVLALALLFSIKPRRVDHIDGAPITRESPAPAVTPPAESNTTQQ